MGGGGGGGGAHTGSFEQVLGKPSSRAYLFLIIFYPKVRQGVQVLEVLQ